MPTFLLWTHPFSDLLFSICSPFNLDFWDWIAQSHVIPYTSWWLHRITIKLQLRGKSRLILNYLFTSQNFKENNNTPKFTKHGSTETSVISSWLIYKALESNLEVEKIANYTSNKEMYIKRDKVRIIKRIILDLRDVIADSKKVVLFEYEMPLLS